MGAQGDSALLGLMENQQYDNLLLSFAQQCGNVDEILDNFFGFMLRKTDFFTGADDSTARTKVLSSLAKFEKLAERARQQQAAKNKAVDEEKKRKAEEKRKKDAAEYEKAQEAKQAKIEEITDEEAEKIQEEEKKKKAAEAVAIAKKAKMEEGKDEEKAEEDDDKEPAPEGNGGTTDRYTWTQQLANLEVTIPIRPGTTSRQIICEIGTSSLKVG